MLKFNKNLPSLKNKDEYFMSIALQEARKGLGFTSPNPMVGAVIVKNNKILSKGYHAKVGEEHAEVNAIKKLTSQELKDSTLYVTLEPCCHYGRTPPCTDLIIRSKIKKVVIATKDVDERVKDKSINILKKAGILVKEGVLAEEALKLNSIYFFYKTQKRPYVVLKAALTLDGKIATKTYKSKWISNEKSRAIVHQLRKRIRAVAVGNRTVKIDTPQLNCRLPGFEEKPIDKLVFSNDKNIKINFNSNGNVFIIDKSLTKNPEIFLNFCYSKEIDSILVEGGSEVYTWFLSNDCVDRLFLFYRPAFLGNDALNIIKEMNIDSIESLKDFKIISVKVIEDNFLVELAKGEPLCLLV